MADIETIEIDLSHKEKISQLYRQYGHRDSAHSFESLFLWKEDMELSIYFGPGLYAVRSGNSSKHTWFFPVGEDEAKKQFISSLLKEPSLTFIYMTEIDTEFLKTHFEDMFEISPEPSDSEYIIDRDTMENLPGSSFSKDRGHINKLIKTHEIKTLSLSGLPVNEIYRIAAIWDSHKQEYTNIIDENATKNALSNLASLNITGVVLIMDGTPCAVAAGFKLNEDTVDCCLQKTTTGVQGLTYYLRQEYAKSQPKGVNFFNWEEDLGIEGLRKAKKLMHPCEMIDMYTGIKK